MRKIDIESVLPHRKPMLLIDEAYVDGKGKALGVYTVTGDEYFVKGHFPENPIVPGVILCEMMAQTCGALLSDTSMGKTPFFTSLDNVRFKNPVKPGDRIEFQCEIIKSKPPFYFAKGKGFVLDKLCVQGEFSFAVIDRGV